MSLGAWLLWLGGSAVSLLYGITNLHDPLFCFVSSVGLIWNALTVALIIWKRKAAKLSYTSTVPINGLECQVVGDV